MIQQYLGWFLTVMGQVLRTGLTGYLNTFLTRFGDYVYALGNGNMGIYSGHPALSAR